MTTEQLNAMKQRLSERKPIKGISIEGVCIAAMEVHQMNLDQIVRKSNLPHAVRCREHLAFIIHNYIDDVNYSIMANLLQRDRTTVMHNVRQARKFMGIEPIYKKQVETILERAKQWELEQKTGENN